MNGTSARLGKAFAAAGFALAIAGTFFVWSDNAPFSETGIERASGLAVLVLALIALAFTVFDRRPRGLLVATSASALALIIAIADYADIASSHSADAGGGIYLTLAGLVIGLIAAAILAFGRFRRPTG